MIGIIIVLDSQGLHCKITQNVLTARFRKTTTDDAVLLSLTFPKNTNPKDFYRIAEQEAFALEPERTGFCCPIVQPTLAIATFAQGPYNDVAVLARDGESLVRIN